MTIVTGYGDVTIPTLDAAKVTIKTTSDRIDGVGVLQATFNLQDFLINLISGDSQASANFSQQLKEGAGMELNFPQALTFGFGLGSEIRAITGFGSVPLADPLPYFYFRFSMGADLVKLGDNSLSSSIAGEVIVAFDPLDPMLFVRVVPPVGGISIGLAGSKNGYIPFRAENSLPLYSTVFDSINLSDPLNSRPREQAIFGHVYLEGSIDISEFVPEVPLELQGNLVFDLDANDDGTLVGAIGSLADDILINKDASAIGRAFEVSSVIWH